MYHFHIPNMTCSGCLGTIIKALQKVDPQIHVEGLLESRTIAITSDTPEASLLKVLESAGYPAQPVLAGS